MMLMPSPEPVPVCQCPSCGALNPPGESTCQICQGEIGAVSALSTAPDEWDADAYEDYSQLPHTLKFAGDFVLVVGVLLGLAVFCLGVNSGHNWAEAGYDGRSDAFGAAGLVQGLCIIVAAIFNRLFFLGMAAVLTTNLQLQNKLAPIQRSKANKPRRKTRRQ